MTSSTGAVRAHNSVITSALLCGILLVAANLRAPITALGPVLSELQQFFSLTPSALGLLNALPLLIFACASPMASWLTKYISFERALFGGLVAVTVGCLLRSSGFYFGLWGGTILISCGIAVGNVLVVPLIKRDFPSHVALCVGLYAATMAVIAALSSGLAAPLSALTQYKWKLSLGVWFVVAFLAAVVWWPQLKNEHYANKHADAQKNPSIWRSGVAWQVSMFMALHTMVFYTVIDWFPEMVKGVGIDSTEAGAYLFAYQAIAVAANLSTSFLIKRMKDQKFLGFLCSLAIVIGVAGLLLKPALALVWLLIAGVGAGMSMVTCLTLFSLRARDHHEASALSGMGQCIGYGLGAVGPLLAGWMHDISGSWKTPLFSLAIAGCVQMFFAVMAGRSRFVS